jgi:hypothetical protein
MPIVDSYALLRLCYTRMGAGDVAAVEGVDLGEVSNVRNLLRGFDKC